MAEKKMNENTITMSTISDIVQRYAETCADAYICQYINGDPVMGSPIIIYNKATLSFYWQSNMTTLRGSEAVVVTTLERGCFGDDTEASHEDIVRAVISLVNVIELLSLMGL